MMKVTPLAPWSSISFFRDEMLFLRCLPMIVSGYLRAGSRDVKCTREITDHRMLWRRGPLKHFKLWVGMIWDGLIREASVHDDDLVESNWIELLTHSTDLSLKTFFQILLCWILILIPLPLKSTWWQNLFLEEDLTKLWWTLQIASSPIDHLGQWWSFQNATRIFNHSKWFWSTINSYNPPFSSKWTFPGTYIFSEHRLF